MGQVGCWECEQIFAGMRFNHRTERQQGSAVPLVQPENAVCPALAGHAGCGARTLSTACCHTNNKVWYDRDSTTIPLNCTPPATTIHCDTECALPAGAAATGGGCRRLLSLSHRGWVQLTPEPQPDTSHS